MALGRRPDDTGSLVDADTLAKLESDLGPEATAEIVMAFLSALSDRLSELRDAEARGDETLVRRVAHTLKSSAALLGASGFAEQALEVEHGRADAYTLIELAPTMAGELRAWLASRMS